MITEIPTGEDFEAAGLNLLHLAWQSALRALWDYEEADYLVADLSAAEAAAAEQAYWVRSQPALGNAFALIQQSLELAIKGRIARVSPYLLISRDPKDWPRGVDTRPTPFSEFRTLDAADLVKVHNTFADAPFEEPFRTFWDGVRRERNVLMHSLSGRVFEPETLIVSILTAAQSLFASKPWPQRLLALEADGAQAVFGFAYDGYDRNIVMRQLETAIQYLTPAQATDLLGFDKRRRAYVCPGCLHAANRDAQDEWPALAQLPAKTPRATQLHCSLCGLTHTVERSRCIYRECKGDVVHEDLCLTCARSQDSPYAFRSGLEADTSEARSTHTFRFSAESSSSSGRDASFETDETAKAHAELAMQAPFLQRWDTVVVLRAWPSRDVVGSWTRDGGILTWRDGENSEELYWSKRLGKLRPAPLAED